MTVRLYASTDAGAPTLNEASGSLISVLDACLVNGYGAKVAAGWEKSFSDSTTGAAYRAPAGNRHYLSVNDAAGPNPRGTIIVNATAWNVGESYSPAPQSVAGGVFIPKHDNVAGSRAWYVLVNDRMLYFWTAWSSASDFSRGALFYFGDVLPARLNDAYATIIGGAHTSMNTTNWSGTWSASTSDSATISLGTTLSEVVGLGGYGTFLHSGKFWARSHTAVGQGVAATTQHDLSRFHTSHISTGSALPLNLASSHAAYLRYYWASGSAGYPNVIDGGLYFSPVQASEGFAYRGTLPGLWVPMSFHSTTFHNQRMFGTGPLAGKELLFLYTPWGNVGWEVSDTW